MYQCQIQGRTLLIKLIIYVAVLHVLISSVHSTKNSTTSVWSEWSPCSVTCGIGEKVRNRTCDDLSPGVNDTNSCNGTEVDTEPCIQEACAPVNGNWSAWSLFNDCSKSCGEGRQQRNRSCNNPSPAYGGLECDGDYLDVQVCNSHDCPGWTNKGKHFIFGFMKNVYEPHSLSLFITTDTNFTVNVQIYLPLYNGQIQSVMVKKGEIKEVNIDKGIMGSHGIENKGIHVEADDEVIIYAINKATYSTDAFVILPVAALGQEYYVLGWYQNSAFMIIGTEDQTEVDIKLGHHSRTVAVNDQSKSAGHSFTIVLNKFQTFFLGFSLDELGDFTGTHIYSTKAVAVLSGSVGATIGTIGRDHMVQQMLPINKWGKDFVSIGMPGCRSSDTFKILGSQGNTVVNITGRSPYRLIFPGDFFTITLSDMTSKTISADKPISVALFANGGCDAVSLGDPTMILLPAIQQFSSDYTFSTVSVGANDFVNYITLVIAASYVNGLRFDLQVLPPTTWLTVEGRSDIKYTEFRIARGVHSVAHTDSQVTFLAVSAGVREYNSYGYPAGYSFRQSEMSCSENDKHKSDDGCSPGLDPCKDLPCLNNGTCTPKGWTNYECICPPTFYGPVCEIDLCKPFPTDVLFLIDKSRSMVGKYFDLEKEFIMNVTSDWGIDADYFQVAVLSFDKYAKLEINFDTVRNLTDFHDKILDLENDGGISNIHEGLSTAKNILNNRNRRVHFTDVKKYLIVLSDGLTSPPTKIQPINSSTIVTKVVAIGEDISHYFLREITGDMNDVLPFDAEKFRFILKHELIHPTCSGCTRSDLTDVLIAIDTSSDMNHEDLMDVQKSIISPLFRKLGTDRPDVRFSFLTFDTDVNVLFVNQSYTNETHDLTIRQTAYFPGSSSRISNFTSILSTLVHSTVNHSGRDKARNIILIVSQFKFDINIADVTRNINGSIEVFTTGMNFKEETFMKMLSLSPSPYHVGTIGSFFADKVDIFLDAFISQLSYIKCDKI